MTRATMDQLFALAAASPLLDEAEQELRQRGQDKLADNLVKLQQDAGLQLEREMNGYDEGTPAPGPQTAALNAAYQPVTYARLDMLRQVHDHLSPGDLKSGLSDLLRETGVEAPQQRASVSPPSNRR